MIKSLFYFWSEMNSRDLLIKEMYPRLAWWYTPVILALGRQAGGPRMYDNPQLHSEFEANLG